MNFNVIGRKKIFLGFSAALFVLGASAIIIFGLRPGIDFKGGTLWQIKAPTDAGSVQNFLEGELDLKGVSVYPGAEENDFLLRLPEISEENHQAYLGKMKEKFPGLEEKRFESIGPAVGGELKKNAFKSIAFVLLGISVYIAYAFRKVSYPVKSWKYGVITLFTLFHDVVVPAGLFAVLGRYLGLEADTNFVVALLVVMGFSVHDTIVVFDRIRENLFTSFGKKDFEEIVNLSVNQTFARSINTSLTLILTLVALLIFGPVHLKYFILIILVGTVFGTYSSIFVASPLLTFWNKNVKNK